MATGPITTPVTWVSGTIASADWFQNVQDNINQILTDEGTDELALARWKAAVIEGSAGSPSTSYNFTMGAQVVPTPGSGLVVTNTAGLISQYITVDGVPQVVSYQVAADELQTTMTSNSSGSTKYQGIGVKLTKSGDVVTLTKELGTVNSSPQGSYVTSGMLNWLVVSTPNAFAGPYVATTHFLDHRMPTGYGFYTVSPQDMIFDPAYWTIAFAGTGWVLTPIGTPTGAQSTVYVPLPVRNNHCRVLSMSFTWQGLAGEIINASLTPFLMNTSAASTQAQTPFSSSFLSASSNTASGGVDVAQKDWTSNLPPLPYWSNGHCVPTTPSLTAALSGAVKITFSGGASGNRRIVGGAFEIAGA